MVSIIISAIAMVFCVLAAITDLIVKKYGWAIFMILLFALNTMCFCMNLNRYNQKENDEPEVEQVEVSDVLRYQIDSVETIHNADTLKTYNITYWIEK